ncbi:MULTISPECIES: sensor histidine kinase [Lysobacter]|uniref:sensor histidine kinase n=1 Tax=Lysobacter TaxID=68 RepID=UPI001F1B6DE3|nr:MULTISPECIES: HAMP domain-containing sensor histidine kinase [Lysobacter]UJB21420.1 HAMP domain-containing histidine kinase [Lysobacter capsici]UJQ29463.1 HAMP domain-containing histidine kinase [Lysobacter gummosus]
MFGVVMLVALSIQAYNSQLLLEHKSWTDILRSLSADYAGRVRSGQGASLPSTGSVRAWYVEGRRNAAGAPDFLVDLPPGYYSTEGDDLDVVTQARFHVLVEDLPPGRLITQVDITALEQQQNRDAIVSGIWAVALLALIGGSIAWLHANLVRPVRDLAERMRSMDPGAIGGRLPTTYRHEEIQIIAQASNAHLERVERFIERERSLLDQASHEFRTPIAVISGAIDVLKQIPLPDASKPALTRIEHAVENLSETMVALLYLAREPDPGADAVEVTALDELLPRLVQDHEHLLRGKAAQLRLGELEPTIVAAPDAMVRIAVSNLIRNAIENTEAGYVEIALSQGIVSVADSGSGFDPVEAARRYRDNLRHAVPVRGQGLGLFLIGRICDRFGWKLAIETTASGGTRARLDVNASVIAP